MSLKPQPAPTVPEETARVAKAVFRKGNPYLTLSQDIGTLFQDAEFADLFPERGQPALSPARLALVTLMQFAEGLSDRQAADAVRSRIDWKYLLGLELTDPGFDFSVLSEFRTRLLASDADSRLFSALLERFRERGLLKKRGKQRTDSTHVLAAIHRLNRLECVGETLRHALNRLADVDPDWVRHNIPADWFERYGPRFENYRLPRQEKERQELAVQVGQDGFALLGLLWSEAAPASLRSLPAVEVLRRVWIQQFYRADETITWREGDDTPPTGIQINSPYDPEARFAIKRDTSWCGYKTHLTETCDEDTPHLITSVQTSSATAQDSEVTPQVHEDLAREELLPAEHLTDEGYIDADQLVVSRKEHDVELLGPVARNGSWQAAAGQGFAADCFVVDWERQQVTCPTGKISKDWTPMQNKYGDDLIHVEFSRADCLSCASRSLCTRARSGARELSLRPQELYEALQERRQYQKTEQFQSRYALRAGIEGTLSQGVRACGLRRCRYVGQRKTHLQNLMTAAAINVVRVTSWLQEIPLARTRRSPLQRLQRTTVATG